MRKAIICLLSVVFVSAFVAGCGPKGAGRDPNMYDGQDRVRTGYLEHTVKYPGETLSIIAGWYTGRTDNWRRIVDANPGLKPEKIRLGQLIMVPMEIVVQEQPLTADAVRKFRPSAPRPGKDQIKDTTGGDGVTQPPADLFDSEPAAKSEAVAPTNVNPADSMPKSDNVRPSDPQAQPGEPMVNTPPANANDTPPHDSSPAKNEKSPAKDDAEREKLLDELLSQ